jgi:hypothetical protein
MNSTFRKYEILPTQWATARKKIEKTGTDPEGDLLEPRPRCGRGRAGAVMP